MAATDDAGSLARVWRVATSGRTAVVLITAVTALSLFGMVYPQRTVMTPAQLADWHASFGPLARAGEALGFDRLFTTWYFVALVLLLAAATLACTLRRVAVRLRAPARRVPSAPGPSLPQRAVDVPAPDDARLLRGAVAALAVPAPLVRIDTAEEDGRFRASLTTGGVGFWGSVLLHVALVVVTLGAVVSALTTFTGRVVLTEGQTFVDERASYEYVTAEPALGPAYTGTSFTLERLEFRYDGDVLTRTIAHVRQGTAQRTAEVNYPLEAAGKSFLLGNSGYSVGLRLGSGSATQESYVALGERRPAGYADTVALPGGVSAELYAVPAASASTTAEVPRRYELRDPVVHARLRATGRTLWEGVLRPGAPVDAQGYRLELTDVRVWNELMVRADRGRTIVYVGLWLAVLGIVVRLADVERRVFVGRDGTRVVIAARHAFGRSAAAALVARVASAVTDGAHVAEEEETA